ARQHDAGVALGLAAFGGVFASAAAGARRGRPAQRIERAVAVGGAGLLAVPEVVAGARVADERLGAALAVRRAARADRQVLRVRRVAAAAREQRYRQEPLHGLDDITPRKKIATRAVA